MVSISWVSSAVANGFEWRRDIFYAVEWVSNWTAELAQMGRICTENNRSRPKSHAPSAVGMWLAHRFARRCRKHDKLGRERCTGSNCLLSMAHTDNSRDKDPSRAADRPPDPVVPLPPRRSGLQPDYAPILNHMIRRRFDAIAQERIPDQLSKLVERVKASGRSRNQHPENQQQARGLPKPSFVTCPFCLGMGERKGANAAQPVIPCSTCRGRGFLDRSPKATDLWLGTANQQ